MVGDGAVYPVDAAMDRDGLRGELRVVSERFVPEAGADAVGGGGLPGVAGGRIGCGYRAAGYPDGHFIVQFRGRACNWVPTALL